MALGNSNVGENEREIGREGEKENENQKNKQKKTELELKTIIKTPMQIKDDELVREREKKGCVEELSLVTRS